MSCDPYTKGSVVRCSGEFKDSDGNFIDPDTVSFHLLLPDGTVTDLDYGVDAEVIKDSDGHYHVDVDADLAGAYTYRFDSTGIGKAADEETFFVEESAFG